MGIILFNIPNSIFFLLNGDYRVVGPVLLLVCKDGEGTVLKIRPQDPKPRWASLFKEGTLQ